MSDENAANFVTLQLSEASRAELQEHVSLALEAPTSVSIILDPEPSGPKARFKVSDPMLHDRLAAFHLALSGTESSSADSHTLISDLVGHFCRIDQGMAPAEKDIRAKINRELAHQRPHINENTDTPLQEFGQGVALHPASQDAVRNIEVSVSELLSNVAADFGIDLFAKITDRASPASASSDCRKGAVHSHFLVPNDAHLNSIRDFASALPGPAIAEGVPHLLVCSILGKIISISSGSFEMDPTLRSNILAHVSHHRPILERNSRVALDRWPEGVVTEAFDPEALGRIETSVNELIQHISATMGKPVYVKDTSFRRGFLSDQGVSLLSSKGLLITPGDCYVGSSARFEPTCGVYGELQKFSGRFGAFSFANSHLTGGIQSIGRYCSIAHNVTFSAAEHPLDRVTTSPFTYEAGFIFGHHLSRTGTHFESCEVLKPESRQDRVVIGNDVWIGEGVYIRGGVSIGDGAVVGARSVVTRDIQPYAIVAGSPAKLLRFRFSETVIKKLQSSKWWTYAFPDFDGLPANDPEAFVDALGEKISKRQCVPYRPAPITGLDIAALFSK